MKKKSGFTLAEVLITLVIIGIIAAMTIPTLMNKTNEQETIVAVKKAYSVLGQAWQRMIAENGEVYPQNLGATREDATKVLGDMFVKYLNVQKVCGQSTDGDCWSTGKYKYFNGSDWYDFNVNAQANYTVRLNDGSSLDVVVYPTYINRGTSEALRYTLGYFIVDVNGDKGPNTLGKDTFWFWISKYGIIPTGLSDETSQPLSTCNSTGEGCTAWVIAKGNMDYLRKEISW